MTAGWRKSATFASLKKTGLSLKEIQALKLRLNYGKGFCSELRAVVEQNLNVLAEETRRLEQLRNELARFLEARRAPAEEPGCPVLEALYYPVRNASSDPDQEC